MSREKASRILNLASTVVGCELVLLFYLLIFDLVSLKRYTQCELMSVHYKHPVLLIEFEEDKAFSLDVCIFVFHLR